MSSFIYTTALDKIRRMKSRIKVIPGGTSAGKTFSILPILINMAIEKPLLEISVVSESLPHLKRGAMKDFLKIMKVTNRYIDDNWNRSNFKYVFSNGSFIEFFSATDGDKLRGARRNILYVNECNNVTLDAYTQLAMRTSEDIYLDYNPTNKFWIEDVKEDKESEVLVLTYKDNEGLPQTIIDFLESKRHLAKTSEYWKNWCRVYLDGLDGILEGVVFDNWKPIDVIPSEAKLIGYGLDFGYTNDPTALTAIYKLNGELILDEVIYKTGLLPSDIARIMKQEGISNNTEIIADSAEPKTIDELRRYGYSVSKAKKGKDSIQFGINVLQEYRLRPTKRSVNIVAELEGYEWKKDKLGNATNIPVDHHNHSIDGIRYLAINKLSKTKASNFRQF